MPLIQSFSTELNTFQREYIPVKIYLSLSLYFFFPFLFLYVFSRSCILFLGHPSLRLLLSKVKLLFSMNHEVLIAKCSVPRCVFEHVI
jgi:hypothetical protein